VAKPGSSVGLRRWFSVEFSLRRTGYLPWLPSRSARRDPISIAAENRITAKNVIASIAGINRSNIAGHFPTRSQACSKMISGNLIGRQFAVAACVRADFAQCIQSLG
jgi:hypothetical protein